MHILWILIQAFQLLSPNRRMERLGQIRSPETCLEQTLYQWHSLEENKSNSVSLGYLKGGIQIKENILFEMSFRDRD